MGDDSSKKVTDLTSTVVLSDDEPESDSPFEHTVDLSAAPAPEAPASAPALPFSKAPTPPSASPDASSAPMPGAPWSESREERKVPAPSADFTGTLAVPPEELKDQVAAARRAADELEAKREAAAGQTEATQADPLAATIDGSPPDDEAATDEAATEPPADEPAPTEDEPTEAKAEASATPKSERPEGVGYDPTGGELAPPSVSAEQRRKNEEERRRREAKSFRASVYAGVGPRRRSD